MVNYVYCTTIKKKMLGEKTSNKYSKLIQKEKKVIRVHRESP